MSGSFSLPLIKNVRDLGWDNMVLHARCSRAWGRRVELMQTYSQVQQLMAARREQVQRQLEKLERDEELSAEPLIEYQPMIDRQAELKKEIAQDEKAGGDGSDEVMVEGRNESMMKALDAWQHKRRFVLGGNAHFTPSLLLRYSGLKIIHIVFENRT